MPVWQQVYEEINDPNFIYGSKVSVWEGFPGGQGTTGPDSAVIDLSESMALIKAISTLTVCSTSLRYCCVAQK